MIRFSHTIFIALVTVCMVSALDRPNDTNYDLKNNKKLQETFNNLLAAVTSVNEERLDALKKFYELQNYVPKVGRTNSRVVAVIIPNKINFDHKKYDEINKKGLSIKPGSNSDIVKIFKDVKDKRISNDYENKINSEETSAYLRQWKGCNKSAAKACNKACKKAFKEVCSDYKCSKSMKKSGKKSCKSICYSQFEYDED